WNRHWRVVSQMNMPDENTIDGITSMSFAYANVQGTGMINGVMVTASGDQTDGFKARTFQASDGSGGAPASLTDVYNKNKWVETVAGTPKCFLNGVDNSPHCLNAAPAGISGASNTLFLLNSSAAAAGVDEQNFFVHFDGAGTFS